MRLRIPPAFAGIVNRPAGIIGRHRPFYFLNLVDRVRGTPSLEDTVGGRTVLVTGASSGIGMATARQLAGAGATVLLVARSEDKLESLHGEIEDNGGSAHVHPCDLSETEDVERLAAMVLERHGGIDVLVNNAGKSIRRSIHLSYDRIHDFDRTMRLNYLAAVRLVLAFLPGMRERRSGHIVNVSTTGVPARPPRFSAYIASKAALEAFADCIAPEVAADGIHVTSVQMPLVRTPMIEPTKIYRSMPALTPEQAADWICQAIIYKPRRIGTQVGNLAALAEVVSPVTVDAVRTAGYELFPDSRAAGGNDRAGEPERVSRTGAAFAGILRGIHW
jgi:short-subunit dehydrogenase